MEGFDLMTGYRKFTIAAVSILSASLLVAFGLIGDGVYSTVMLATVGGYLTANVAQKATMKQGIENA